MNPRSEKGVAVDRLDCREPLRDIFGVGVPSRGREAMARRRREMLHGVFRAVSG